MPEESTNAALLELLQALEEAGYAFTAVTPATHARLIARRAEAEDLRDVFGWNLPYRSGLLPAALQDIAERAGLVEDAGGGLVRSRLRVASLEGRLFLHSAYPTDDEDSVFFGPDTYRYAAMLAAEIPTIGAVQRVVDIGAGSGAGGIVAAAHEPGAKVTLTDVNPGALRLAHINARHAGVGAELVEGPALDPVEGPVDLVIANPPYIMDEKDRAYRNGGGLHGAGLSRDWALAAARRLESGGHMLLYTGVAIVGGRDALRDVLEERLPPLGCSLRYREIDPDIFGEELETRAYRDVERIAAVAAVIAKG